MASRIPIPTHLQRASSPSPAPRSVSAQYPGVAPSSQNQSSSNMSNLSGHASNIADTRRKQSKRDEAIRKKIEGELSRKRTISTNQFRKKGLGRAPGAAKGTVAALKPSPALTVPETITVSDASQLCAAKRTDCVLVVDDEEGLSGIFTAKDLAFRVTAEGLDPRSTPVSAIMTRNPMVTRDTTSATEALQLMVTRGFRHLPVCNEEGNVVGLLDITKVFHEALEKVERGSSASQKLYTALEGVQSELGGGLAANPQAAAMLAYVDALREKTALPDLTTVMDSRTQPATVTPKTSVREAAKLMKERRTTAVCVMDSLGGSAQIAGIFTSKDVVLRVIAAGLDPGKCSVVRVMTPHPDTAPPTMTVQDALKKMHVGHYLNLPVVESDGRLVAIVDVLKLTYATLEQMNAIVAENSPENNEGGPMWSKFFDSFAAQDDNESVMSGSGHPGMTDVNMPPSYPNSPATNHILRGTSFSEVYPHDSASAVDEGEPLPALNVGQSSVGHHRGAAASVVDDGTYVFKFRTPSGRTHRFQARNDNFENLRDIVAGKLSTDPFFTAGTASEGGVAPDPMDFALSYTDNDGDTVLITSDTDVADAVKLARKAKSDRVVLFIQGGNGWKEAGAGESEKKAQEVSEAAAREIKEVEKAESVVVPHIVVPDAPSTPHHHAADDLVFGIPRDLVLPASLGFLGVIIVSVFVVSRLSK